MKKDELQIALESAQHVVRMLERLVPLKGSDSGALLADTRSGADDKATKSNGSELALPDQGWVSPVMAVRDKMLKEAEAHRKMAEIESNPVTFMERRRHYEGAAAGLVAYASMLEEAVGEIRTQSVAYGDEVEAAIKTALASLKATAAACDSAAELQENHGITDGAKASMTKAAACRDASRVLESLLPELSRKERSVSGNANMEARRDEARNQTGS